MTIMEEKFDYLPNRNSKYIAILFSVIILIPLFVFLLILCFFNERVGLKYVIVPIFIALIVIMFLIEHAKFKITFTKEVLYIQRNKRCKLIEYKYGKYSYAFYCRSLKGRLYLVLSPNELNRKKVKRIVAIEEYVGKISWDSYVVIFIDENNKQIDVVREYISKNIKNICEI